MPGVLGAEGMQGRGNLSLHSGWQEARQSENDKTITQSDKRSWESKIVDVSANILLP